MSDVVTLTLRAPVTAGRIGADAITPDALAGLAAPEIAALPLWVGPRRATVGELFTIAGERSDQVRIVGDLAGVDGLGTGMSRGTLTIDGAAGDGLGAGMSGGSIEALGDVGDAAGMAMAGGRIRVAGRAGDRLGAASPGASRGMTGGEIVVRGAAGADAGHRARRGLIVIGGDAGPGAAHAMIAGTVVVLGRVGPRAGALAKRGTLVTVGDVSIPPTYRLACRYRPVVLRVLFHYLARTYALPIEERVIAGLYARYTGDLAEIGRGEILAWVAA
jgi:formylmethanofuran dehydrogenase subunit C